MLLFCDSDCLIQIFISNQVPLLRWLRANYGLEAIVVPEVDAELSRHQKFKDQFEADLRKAETSGIITVFDYSRPEVQLSFLPPTQAATTMRAILTTGHVYRSRLGRGEAFSHAACAHLDMPLLSHDINAVRILLKNNLKTAAPVLRVFDLVVLAYHKQGISQKECKAIRQALQGSSEWLPSAFDRNSFVAGLPYYNARLHDLSDYTGTPPSCQRYNDLLYLPRK
jgi:hypothetical protein